ncbi:saccharopine dehydrogenase family protein [candidate division CSSED10-310 bacterium]|uniref:Saccharopine dehydrogenase family protein n=1 Tax=candidate division CSSED10-310 bacterium TaxID=2855610 RepID=A0ABV6Z1G1_UNCC1
MVLGTGLQGKAVLHDLESNDLITDIVAADIEISEVEAYLRPTGARKTKCVSVDASCEAELSQLLQSEQPDIVICMLPPSLGYLVAKVALSAKIHYVSSSYTGQISKLDREAHRKGIIILPEMGMDPGIDLILGQLAVHEVDEVRSLYFYGGGIPEPACADQNPLHYKITWSFDGVLKAYNRPARLLKNEQTLDLPASEIFREEHLHHLNIPSVGRLEAFPNGDALKYIKLYSLGPALKNIGRYSIRWPGHSQFWQVMADLGFLEDKPLISSETRTTPHQFLVDHLTPRLQFHQTERDVVVVRIVAHGVRQKKQVTVTCDLIDYRDLKTGLFAMNRTVGFTASIAALMILNGEIKKSGVLSPAVHVPPDQFFDKLATRGMKFQKQVHQK